MAESDRLSEWIGWIEWIEWIGSWLVSFVEYEGTPEWSIQAGIRCRPAVLSL